MNTTNKSVHAENKINVVGNMDKPEWIEARIRVYSNDGVAPTLNGIGSGGNTEPKIVVMGKLDIKGKDQIRRVYNKEYLAPTISTCGGGNKNQK